MHHFGTLILTWSSRAYIYFLEALERMISYGGGTKGVGITQSLGWIVLNPSSVSWENVLRRCAVSWEMWWKGIIWPPTSSSWKAIPRAACLSGLITGSLLKIPQCSLLNPPSGRAPAQLFPSLEGGWSSSPALCWDCTRAPFVWCSFGAFCSGNCLGGRAGRAGQPPRTASS